jgi:hypothetical protein
LLFELFDSHFLRPTCPPFTASLFKMVRITFDSSCHNFTSHLWSSLDFVQVKKSSSKRQARRSASGIFGVFSPNQLSEFKQAFQFIDFNKDGYIDKRDVVSAFDSLGRQYPDEEINEMISEGDGQINFAMFITLIGEKIMGMLLKTLFFPIFDEIEFINQCRRVIRS